MDWTSFTSGPITAVASVSRGYLNRLFRSAFGLGPANLLERARLARAEVMLARTALTVEAIARQCGFADLSHFSHRFRAVYGIPPKTYRMRPGSGVSVLDHAGTRRFVHHGLLDDITSP